MGTQLQKITPSLWYVKEAEEAAKLYTSIFPDSRIDRVSALPAESPSGPAGSVKLVQFTLFGQKFSAMSAGPLDEFNHAISFTVNCEDQAEIDRYSEALAAGGGTIEPCGWVKDKFGVCWQITPIALGEMLTDPDRGKAKRVAEAMLKMKKLDLAALRAAHAGKAA